jgi:hypothetical protein
MVSVEESGTFNRHNSHVQVHVTLFNAMASRRGRLSIANERTVGNYSVWLFHPVAVSILCLVSPLRLTTTQFTHTQLTVNHPCILQSHNHRPPKRVSKRGGTISRLLRELRRKPRHIKVGFSKSGSSAHTLTSIQVEEVHTVFGKTLKESLKYASVQISTANANGELYVWGYIPVVVAKWCVRFLADLSINDADFVQTAVYI